MVDLTKIPFSLSQDQIKWVEETKASMSIEEKIGQLFFLVAQAPDDHGVKAMVDSVHAGGIMYRPMPSADVARVNNFVQQDRKISLFVAANLEEGANGIVTDGTHIGNNLLVAATNDEANAYKLGEVSMKEAGAVGGNMAFAPVIDINFNWENPIANIRSFGDDPELVSKMGRAYMNGVHDNGGVVTIKHFPGDGVDGRDHHIVKSINGLSWQDWNKTFGKVYRDCIESGATGMMVGHIALPGFYKEFYPDDDSMQPASLSYEIIGDLVRTKLGFNGLVMTDATLMTGFCAEMRRKDSVPRAIATGIDMFLFTKDLHEDYGYMMDGYKNGIISDERLDDALTRILGLKAHLNLHSNSPKSDISVIGSHGLIAEEIIDKAITLVKNNEGILPLNQNIKKIGLISLGNEISMDVIFAKMAGEEAYNMAIENLPHKKFKKLLLAEGFQVEELDMSDLMGSMQYMTMGTDQFRERFDLILYFIKKETKSNQSNLRLEFKSFGGFDSPWFVKEVPTMCVSLGNPYHGYDLPMIETFVNAYTASDTVLELLMDKLMGRSEFKGISPVRLEYEPFMGNIDKWLH